MLVLAVPDNHLEGWYVGKHVVINNELFLMHMKMLMVVTMTMVVMAITIIDFTVPSYSSFKGGSGVWR